MVNLSIVILSYNTKNLTVDCIKSICRQYGKELEQKELEIIVVDNASSDESVSEISSLPLKKGSIKLILNKKNFGFAKGCDIGAKAAGGEHILFLNSDTQVQNKGFLQMADFLENNKNVGVVGGRLLNSDGTLQPSGGNFYNLWNLFLMLAGGERFGLVRKSAKKEERVEWVSGACMMIKREVFNNLGGFDEYFFMYIEDMDLCFRARKMGLLTYFYPNIKLVHKSIGSSNRTFAIINIYRGILHFYSKHNNVFEYIIAKILLVIKAEILILVGFLTFNKGLIERYKKAIT